MTTDALKVVEDAPEEVTPDAETAFLVVILFDGTVKATADLTEAVTPSREASIGDIRRASQELVFEINNNQAGAISANNVLQVLQAQSQAQADAKQQAQIRKALASQGVPIIGGGQ